LLIWLSCSVVFTFLMIIFCLFRRSTFRLAL
jgi:hypothetical protein